jgi:hypothetical protein
MLPDINEYMVKEHQKWLEEQVRQIALRKKYKFAKSSLRKEVFSGLINLISKLGQPRFKIIKFRVHG